MTGNNLSQYAGILWNAAQVSKKLGLTVRTLKHYAATKLEEFPAPVAIGPRRIAWRAEDIIRWVDSRKAKE